MDFSSSVRGGCEERVAGAGWRGGGEGVRGGPVAVYLLAAVIGLTL